MWQNQMINDVCRRITGPDSLFRRCCALSRASSSLFAHDELVCGIIPSCFRLVSSMDYLYIH
jgi:hypothetical protein